ncbi:MAG: hypothetical protein ACPKOP_00280 [Sphaerochaetaceae bacterium]
MNNQAKIFLDPSFFNQSENPLYHSKKLTVSLFRYKSGVEAVRVNIGRGEFVWLPYLGQQVWDWKVDGRSQKFSGFMNEPAYGKTFVENYGAFMIHCGFTGMGNPKADDTHLHHGELPVSRFNQAWLEFCDDELFPIALCGVFNYKVPFKGEYRFAPKVYLGHDGLSAKVAVDAENVSHTPLEYMYLAHINFDFAGSKTINYGDYQFDAEHVRIIGGGPYAQEPDQLLSLSDEDVFDPEVVAVLSHKTDYEFISTLRKEDGSSRWVSQQTKGLDHTVMWMTHNADRGANGFALPATAGPEGKNIERALKKVKTLKAKGSVRFEYAFGYNE